MPVIPVILTILALLLFGKKKDSDLGGGVGAGDKGAAAGTGNAAASPEQQNWTCKVGDKVSVVHGKTSKFLRADGKVYVESFDASTVCDWLQQGVGVIDIVPTSWLLEAWLNHNTLPYKKGVAGTSGLSAAFMGAVGKELQNRIGVNGTLQQLGWNGPVDGLEAKRALALGWFATVEPAPGFYLWK